MLSQQYLSNGRTIGNYKISTLVKNYIEIMVNSVMSCNIETFLENGFLPPPFKKPMTVDLH